MAGALVLLHCRLNLEQEGGRHRKFRANSGSGEGIKTPEGIVDAPSTRLTTSLPFPLGRPGVIRGGFFFGKEPAIKLREAGLTNPADSQKLLVSSRLRDTLAIGHLCRRHRDRLFD